MDTAISRYQFDLDLKKKVFEEHAYEILKKKDQEVPKDKANKLNKKKKNSITACSSTTLLVKKEEHEAFLFN